MKNVLFFVILFFALYLVLLNHSEELDELNEALDAINSTFPEGDNEAIEDGSDSSGVYEMSTFLEYLFNITRDLPQSRPQAKSPK